MRPHLAASLLLVLAAACGQPAPVSPVLVVGVDGLEPTIVDALVRAGRMPHLARIAEAGVLGELATLTPTYSPVIWTTVATGQGMDRHGIVDFLSPAGVPFTSNCRKVPALWNLVSDADRTVDVVGWWVSWPAEPVNGRLVSSYAAGAQYQIVWKGNLWDELEDQTWPRALQREIEPLVVGFRDAERLKREFWSAFRKPARAPAGVAERAIQDLMWTFAGDRSFAAIAESFLGSGAADLTMVYLAMPDVAGHRFWRYHRPADMRYVVPAEDVADYGDVLNESYAEVDRMLGRLVARAPADATVIVLSDHGMHVDPKVLYDPESPNSGHHEDSPPGVFAAAGPHVKRQGNLLGDLQRARVGHVLGVAPLVLRLLELPIPGHWPAARAHPLEDLLDDEWRGAHRRRLGPADDGSFREATAALRPPGDLDAQFIDALKAIGYLGDDG